MQETEFSLQLDESTLPNNELLLLAYVCFVHDGKLFQEMFGRRLETDTKGLMVYETLKDFLQQQRIPMNNIIACATDGAASMVASIKIYHDQ